MQHQSDFPALSESIRTLNRLADSEEQDMNYLASLLIRDFALTNKILRVVNSAYYSRFAGKIGTISRAIVVLGINTVRTIAASLIFFEHLHNKVQAGHLKDLIAAAVFSATLARQAAEDAGLEHTEEGFLCGMLHTLGRVLVAYYLHSESEEIDRLVKQEGIEQVQAERRVLGTTYQDMGIAIAKQWNFPDVIVQGMQQVDPAKPGDLKRMDVKLRLIANFSNQATELLGAQGDDDQPVRDLLKRYRMGLAISEKRFTRMVDEARKEFHQLSSLESRHNSAFMKQLIATPALEQNISMGPNFFVVDFTACTMSASLRTSQLTAIPPISSATRLAPSKLMSATQMPFAPSCANRIHNAFPIPLAPPVSTMILFLTSI
jgi:HD-like signal output (HDOD) protein